MAAKVLSILLGTDTAKLAEVSLSGKKVQLFSAVDVQLPEGSVEDGQINDVAAIASALSIAFDQNGIKPAKIDFVLGSKRIASKEVTIPFVKDNKIGDIIKINAPEYFPIQNMEDYVLSHSVIEVIKSENTKQLRLNVTATPQDLLSSYYDLADALKLDISFMDYAGNAILQILSLQTSESVEAIVQFNKDNTVINIMNGNTLVMQRSISYGLDSVLKTIEEGFQLESDDAKLFVQDNDISKICSAQQDVSDMMSVIVNGIGRVLEFYANNNREEEDQITGLKLIGEGTIVNGLDRLLAQNIGIPTTRVIGLNLIDIKSADGSVTPEIAANFLENIGSVIKPMNIRLAYRRGADDEKIPWGLLVIAGIIAVAASLIVSAVLLFYKARESSLNKQIESLQEMQALEDKFIAAEANYAQIKQYYDSTNSNNELIEKLIKAIEKHAPTSLSVKSLSVNEGAVTMNCSCISKRAVAKFITEMKDIKYVQDVKVTHVSEGLTDAGKSDGFTITFNIVNEVSEEESDEKVEITTDEDLGITSDEPEASEEQQSEVVEGAEGDGNDIVVVEDNTENSNGENSEVVVEGGN